MLVSEKLLEELNDQMNFEFHSANIYFAMASYCKAENLDGFANFFLVQAEEERFHGMKLFNYIHDIGHHAMIKGFEDPNNEFSSVLDCYEKAYEHEKEVTKRFYHLSDTALDEREHATMNFLKWYIDEQVEEESMFDSIIEKLKRIENDSNAFYALDQEFAARSFTPPADNNQ